MQLFDSFMSFSPSAWNFSGPYGRNFMKFGIGIVETTQVSLKSDKNNG